MPSGCLALDDPLNNGDGKGFDVDAVGDIFVGHDGREDSS